MELSELCISEDRLTAEVNALAACSDAPAPAVTRILYTGTDLDGRDFIKKAAKSAGLGIREDAIGNIYMRWAGADSTLPAVATGSHTDAIPYSGKYDGVVGVLGAIEAIRALKQAGFQPQRDIEAIMFTGEAPTRFGLGCIGSRAISGCLSPQSMLALKDKQGKSFDQVRKAAGCRGNLSTVALPKGCYKAFVELHIEQGPLLDAAAMEIGVVTAISAPATIKVTLTGEGGHAGACLMPDRKDALPPAAEIALFAQNTAMICTSEDAVATTGHFEVFPGVVNSIPSKVAMEIDVRDTHLDTRDAMVNDIIGAIYEIARKYQVKAETQILNADAPASCDAHTVDIILRHAQMLGYTTWPMISRAYHDSLFMAQVCPTAMIFVPSLNGISHRPEEYTSPHEIAKGVHVLALSLAALAER